MAPPLPSLHPYWPGPRHLWGQLKQSVFAFELNDHDQSEMFSFNLFFKYKKDQAFIA